MSDLKIHSSDPSSESAEDRRDRHARGKKIGDKLRALYDDVATQPVPDEFLKLLEDADEAPQNEGK